LGGQQEEQTKAMFWSKAPRCDAFQMVVAEEVEPRRGAYRLSAGI
jgi:hypothetical protein